MYDSRKYAQLMTQGKLEEAGDYYSHSFVGACAYAHGVLKVNWKRAFVRVSVRLENSWVPRLRLVLARLWFVYPRT